MLHRQAQSVHSSPATQECGLPAATCDHPDGDSEPAGSRWAGPGISRQFSIHHLRAQIILRQFARKCNHARYKQFKEAPSVIGCNCIWNSVHVQREGVGQREYSIEAHRAFNGGIEQPVLDNFIAGKIGGGYTFFHRSERGSSGFSFASSRRSSFVFSSRGMGTVIFTSTISSPRAPSFVAEGTPFSRRRSFCPD